MTPGLGEWSSPQDLADWLGIEVNTVYRWNHFGTGPTYVKIGRHVRYRRRDIEAWLLSRERR